MRYITGRFGRLDTILSQAVTLSASPPQKAGSGPTETLKITQIPITHTATVDMGSLGHGEKEDFSHARLNKYHYIKTPRAVLFCLGTRLVVQPC
jgi:hypothetical protein